MEENQLLNIIKIKSIIPISYYKYIQGIFSSPPYTLEEKQSRDVDDSFPSSSDGFR